MVNLPEWVSFLIMVPMVPIYIMVFMYVLLISGIIWRSFTDTSAQYNERMKDVFKILDDGFKLW